MQILSLSIVYFMEGFFLVFSLLRAHESRTLFSFIIVQLSVAGQPSTKCMNGKLRQMTAVGVRLKWTGFN